MVKGREKRGLKYLIWTNTIVNISGCCWMKMKFCSHVHAFPQALPPSRGSLSDSLGPQSEPSSDTFPSRPLLTSGPWGPAPAEDAAPTVSLPHPTETTLRRRGGNQLEEQRRISREARGHDRSGRDVIVNQHHFLFFVASLTQLTWAIITPCPIQVN